MIEDSKRREVARKLRELPDDVYLVEKEWRGEGIETECHDQADYYQIHEAIFGRLPADHMHPGDYEELHSRLADLIDRPKCENYGGEEGTNAEEYEFACTACGFATCGNVYDWNYCPSCGAEVVR